VDVVGILEQQKNNHSFLVSDGGSENNNKQIDQFISEISEHRITKITALKDIQFSNSPVEAIHRIIKGRYIRNRRFETLEGFTKFLNEAVKDYNYERPHYKHFPQTPAEVYFETGLKLNIKKHISKAVQQRVKNNLATACRICRKPSENSLSLITTSSSLIPSEKQTYGRPKVFVLRAQKSVLVGIQSRAQQLH
jgi:hypothetical protein